ncbi:MAG: formyltetrahydrofolate deformylase [Flammeovirgaceae bacterium]
MESQRLENPSTEQKYVILIDCPDEKGLVYKISGVLYRHNFNIISNNEFVDNELGHFFMRTEVVGDFDEQKLITELRSILPNNSLLKVEKMRKKNVVLLATKEHHCLGDLLVRHEFDELNANILAVVANHDVLKTFTEKFNIPFHFISHEGLTREKHEELVKNVIDSYNPDFLVLAKYMRILTPNFVRHYENKIINIHHSFLPAFIGANPYKQAFDRGVKMIGATAHYVNHSLDEGPIIVQDIIQVDHTKDAKSMAKAGRDVEKIVLARALKLVFEDKTFVNGNKTVIFD